MAQTLAASHKEKRKEHASQLKECREFDAKIAELQHEMERIAPKTIQLNERIKHSKKKIEQAIVQEKIAAKKVAHQEQEIQGLEADIADLKKEEVELEKRKDKSQQSKVMNGAQLKEYHRIKEAAQVETTQLRNALAAVYMIVITISCCVNNIHMSTVFEEDFNRRIMCI
jgi:structural maintenance of chromosome 1